MTEEEKKHYEHTHEYEEVAAFRKNDLADYLSGLDEIQEDGIHLPADQSFILLAPNYGPWEPCGCEDPDCSEKEPPEDPDRPEIKGFITVVRYMSDYEVRQAANTLRRKAQGALGGLAEMLQELLG